MPTTTIAIKFAGQSFEVTEPKQFALSNLVCEVRSNGTAAVTIGSVSAVNDPAVVDKSYAGQALVIRTTGEAVAAGVAAGIQAAGAAATKP